MSQQHFTSSGENGINQEQWNTPMSPMQLQQALFSLTTQVQQHSTIFQQLEQLQEELKQMTNKYQAACQEINTLRRLKNLKIFQPTTKNPLKLLNLNPPSRKLCKNLPPKNALLNLLLCQL